MPTQNTPSSCSEEMVENLVKKFSSIFPWAPKEEDKNKIDTVRVFLTKEIPVLASQIEADARRKMKDEILGRFPKNRDRGIRSQCSFCGEYASDCDCSGFNKALEACREAVNKEKV